MSSPTRGASLAFAQEVEKELAPRRPWGNPRLAHEAGNDLAPPCQGLSPRSHIYQPSVVHLSYWQKDLIDRYRGYTGSY